MSEIQPERRKLTLKHLVVCLVIIAPITVWLISYKETHRQKYQDLCVGTFGNLGQAFALYRADYDDKMPVLDLKNKDKTRDALEKYAGGKSIICPSGPENYQYRTAAKDSARPTEQFFYGGQDESVLAICLAHTSNGVGFNSEISPYFYTKVSWKMNILFRNGSVKSVSSFQNSKAWYVEKGKLLEVPDPDPKQIGRRAVAYRFPFEPALEFEK